MIYHMTAFLIGFVLDLILGDPYFMPHPIRLIGTTIGKLDEKLNDSNEKKSLANGRLLVVIVTSATVVVTAVILIVSYSIHRSLGLVVESIMTYQILATKCLKDESMKVYKCLRNEDTKAARKAVSMIVGRDTDVLDNIGITKAAVETVAENTSDGVIA
ncbi:MAG: cobalamin biosynthesis protein, partial [Lachnospiraceae bacterium]|nr:cobalamin biosynthesis protein [Lachnospiraceae bacterium]